MKILYFPISGRKGASSRYRVYQYIPFLEEAGFEVKIQLPGVRAKRGIRRLVNSFLERAAVLRAAREADILYIQKRLFDGGLIKRMLQLRKRVVFDFDDSIFTSPKSDWSHLTKSRVHRRIKATFKGADLVLSGNEYLKTFALEWGATNVTVLPTALDTSRYPLKTCHGGEASILGWIGSSVNYRYLNMLSSVIPLLSSEFKGLRLLVVSDGTYGMHGAQVENRPWSEETEVRDIHDMDVGLMPLEDNEWTRGKCALKALQYMASGIPAVCSPVGANLDVVESGRQGLLAGSDDEWVASIRCLLGSSALRKRMGIAGRERVESGYDLRTLAAIKIRLLRSL